eukprot:jgi/Chlat1/7844/Chrsp66S07337
MLRMTAPCVAAARALAVSPAAAAAHGVERGALASPCKQSCAAAWRPPQRVAVSWRGSTMSATAMSATPSPLSAGAPDTAAAAAKPFVPPAGYSLGSACRVPGLKLQDHCDRYILLLTTTRRLP